MARREDPVGNHQRRRLVILTAACLLTGSSIANANGLLSGCGFGWGSGDPLPGLGETLDFVGVVSSADRDLSADLVANEYTLRITGLISTGPVNFGAGFYGVDFTGGTFEFWRDPNGNASFGTGPPNATVPSTFVDRTTSCSSKPMTTMCEQLF